MHYDDKFHYLVYASGKQFVSDVLNCSACFLELAKNCAKSPIVVDGLLER